MNESINLTKPQIKIMLLCMCLEGYINFSYKYYRIKEDESRELFDSVSEEFWNRLAAGETDLMLNPMRSVERIAQSINKKFIWKQRLLTLEGLPQGLNCA